MGSIKRSGLQQAALLCVMLCAPLQLLQAADAPKVADTRAITERKLEAAQQRLDAAAREVADLSMSMSDDAMPGLKHLMTSRGAVLGIGIGAGRDEGQGGVEVVSVSPGGGAADAGLQVGDVITEVNGKALQRKDDSSPREQLLSAMRATQPGDKVRVRYLRAGKTQTATVVAHAPAARMFDMPFVAGTLARRLEDLPMMFRESDGVFGSAEMVALTPKLGQYFGTDKGLLVVRAPGDDRLKLEEGDVIVDIDNRVPESAAHAARILGSYEPGEKLRLNVLRMKKHMTLEVDVPAEPEGRFRRRFERSRIVPAPEAGPMPSPTMLPLPPAAPGAIVIRTLNETV